MRDLNEILNCFPSVLDWRDIYLDDGRQRILGDAPGFSVEIILGSSLDHIGIFSSAEDRPEMLSVMAMFLENQDSASMVLDRSKMFFTEKPDGIFHAILGTHTLTISHIKECTHFRVSPSTDL
jgi:hypothetical protein